MFHSSSLRFLQSTAPAPAAIAAKPHAAMLNAPVEGVGGFVGTGVAGAVGASVGASVGSSVGTSVGLSVGSGVTGESDCLKRASSSSVSAASVKVSSASVETSSPAASNQPSKAKPSFALAETIADGLI